MSNLFDITISRPNKSISRDEWRSLILSDNSLELIDVLPGRNPMTLEFFDVAAPDSAKWKNHPDNVPMIFRYGEGEINSSSIDEHTAIKAKEIANKLKAVVTKSID